MSNGKIITVKKLKILKHYIFFTGQYFTKLLENVFKNIILFKYGKEYLKSKLNPRH